MLKNKIYFNDVPDVEKLYLDEVFFEFENIPILFSCVDIYEKYYLCICSEIRKIQKWVITPISSELLIKMLKDKITIYEAFKESIENKIIAQYNRATDISYKKVKFVDIEECDLPDKDEFLEDEDSFVDYINELASNKDYDFSSLNNHLMTYSTNDKNYNKYTQQPNFKEITYNEESNLDYVNFAA